MDVEEARTHWLQVRDRHSAFAQLLKNRLVELTRKLGIYAEVSARAKDTHSLVKKLISKPHLSYETLPDKVGVRVVVRYRCELAPIEEMVRRVFSFKVIEDKSTKLGTDRIGYQSIHVDSIALKDTDSDYEHYPADEFFGELQIRTLGQHLWSEISHDTFYKNDELANKLPSDLKRRVNLTAGLVEVADREFDRMNGEVQPDPEVQMFTDLEKLYYSVASRRPDVQLSLDVISHILPLYGAMSTKAIFQELIVPAFERNREYLAKVYANPDKNYDGVSAFFFQPEALLLFERLEFDRDQLLAKWNERFPEKELDRVAEAFGFALT